MLINIGCCGDSDDGDDVPSVRQLEGREVDIGIPQVPTEILLWPKVNSKIKGMKFLLKFLSSISYNYN